MTTYYVENFITRVLEKSNDKSWDRAVLEWEIVDCYEDKQKGHACVCGKEQLRYLYKIKNKYNGNEMFPIGSSCIKKFDRDDLNEKVSVSEKLFALLHHVENGTFIKLNGDFFSKDLLKHLYDHGAFVANQYNQFNPEIDYEFMLKMFNKRSEPTSQQQKKIKGIIAGSILPYLRRELKNKMLYDSAPVAQSAEPAKPKQTQQMDLDFYM